MLCWGWDSFRDTWHKVLVYYLPQYRLGDNENGCRLGINKHILPGKCPPPRARASIHHVLPPLDEAFVFGGCLRYIVEIRKEFSVVMVCSKAGAGAEHPFTHGYCLSSVGVDSKTFFCGDKHPRPWAFSLVDTSESIEGNRNSRALGENIETIESSRCSRRDRRELLIRVTRVSRESGALARFTRTICESFPMLQPPLKHHTCPNIDPFVACFGKYRRATLQLL